LRHLELVDGLAQLGALLAFDAPRYAAAARIVGHQNQIAAREADEGGEGRALGAAFVLVHLDDQLLAFREGVLDAGAAGVYAWLEVGSRDFLEGKEAVALAAVVYERGLEARLDAGDYTLVDIAFALLFACGLDIQIEQLLTFDDRDAQFFGLRRVKQHAFHFFFSRAHESRDGLTARSCAPRGYCSIIQSRIRSMVRCDFSNNDFRGLPLESVLQERRPAGGA
jgi:hypothetical protein